MTPYERQDTPEADSAHQPLGPVLSPEGVNFSIWAPDHEKAALVLESGQRREIPMNREDGGRFSVFVPELKAGALYRFRLGDDEVAYSDPLTRYQPQGPFGPSQVVDPEAYRWSDDNWSGIEDNAHIIYEMHVGTFTRDGTWRAAAAELSHLRDLGITTIQMMPVNDFDGAFGWGYDGVNWYAPTRLYGTPDDLKFFIDEAHRYGLCVIMDVVYNHFGPAGCFLKQFAKAYASETHKNDWSEGINYDGPGSAEVRRYFRENAAYWIREFHADGLRLDATHGIKDDSARHIIAEIVSAARNAAGSRKIFIVAENEPQDTIIVRPQDQGGYGVDALANDDFHHSAIVALTGRNEAYFTDYLGKPQEFISLAKYGYLYQGQRYEWQHKNRGTSTRGLFPHNFVNFIENHDQLANTGRGFRSHCLSGPARHRAMTGLLLLAPQTPMILQGQEFAASSPFYYFADHGDAAAEDLAKHRWKEVAQFPSTATVEMRAHIPAPSDRSTFMLCKLDLAERYEHAEAFALHRDLIHLRKNDQTLRHHSGGIDGAVLNSECFLIRYFDLGGDDRLLLCNFGRDTNLRPAPEPLLAPPERMKWQVLWSSESPSYGGGGTPAADLYDRWHVPGHATLLLKPVPRTPEDDAREKEDFESAEKRKAEEILKRVEAE